MSERWVRFICILIVIAIEVHVSRNYGFGAAVAVWIAGCFGFIAGIYGK